MASLCCLMERRIAASQRIFIVHMSSMVEEELYDV
eukprot:CAMPEP_0202440714 /NCGR_PEP_ID=MMETSP1345-20130828/36851_1 /ASSEMBLY_ACC=CAM_ASM_000843 /TAXON_ID=342563 /ORGANISM="Fabrea Fabrea salina" /LENGTH=34 /DNA_ID= /DNA_START= /DNA_END= /DNA_ORIENTATION=